MRITLLHYAAHPVVGGVETVMREHSRRMARAGHTARIMAGRGAQVDPEVGFTGLPLLDSMAPEVLALKPFLDAGIVPPEFSTLASTIESQIRERLADTECLIVHNVCSLNKNLAATTALRRIAGSNGPRLALWHHDLAWTTPRYRAQLHDGDPWGLLRRDWPGAIQVTVSAARQQELAQLLGVPLERIRVVPNGIDPYMFLGIDEETAGLVRRFNLMEADPLLLLPARITPRKNIELALCILGELRTQRPGAVLLVTGPLGAHNAENQTYMDSLARLGSSLGVHEQTVFLSQRIGAAVSDAGMRQLFRLADALLLPSREEGFGIPILEAGLAGIPVFCTEIAPLLELGKDEVTYFRPDADAAHVARQISAVLDSDHRHALRKRVLREYGWDQIYQSRLAPILSELTA